MPVLSIVIDTPGQGGVNPRRVKVITTDFLSTVTSPGYLNPQVEQGYILQSTDAIDMIYQYSELEKKGIYGVFTVDITGGVVTLSSFVGNGDVILPVVDGNVPIFNGTDGQIKDGGSPPLFTTSVDGQTISTTLSSDPGGTFQSLESLVTQTVPQSSTNLTGLLGQVNCSTVSTLGSNISGVIGQVNCQDVNAAVVVGVQGKIIPVGKNNNGNVFPVFGIFDLTNTDISTGTMALLGGYMGASAAPGTYPGLFGIIIDNGTQAIANAQIGLVGGATNLLELFDNNEVVGPTYFVDAGTSSGSAGDTTKCNASKVLKISVNNTDYWLPLFASNS